MPLRFLSKLSFRGFTFSDSQLCTLHGSHHFSVIFQSACVAFFFFLQSVSSFLFLSCIGLHEFKWTSLALQAQSGVDKVWFHPLSSPLCVCLCVCGCWSQDCVYELRLLSRRGDLLSEPSPSVNVSTAGRFGEQPCLLHIAFPPCVWTHSTSSVSLS